MNSLIVFDLDGTLADTREDLAVSVNLLRRSYGLSDLSLTEIIKFVGGGMKVLVEKALIDGHKINQIEAQKKFTDFYYNNLTVKTRLYDGVIDTISTLSNRGYYIAVLSNKPGDMCREITKYFKLSQYLVTTMGGGDSPAIKPAVDGLLQIIKKAETLGFKKEDKNIWMVGDHHTDLKLAENAGIKSVFCKYGFGRRQDLKSDFDIESIGELKTILN